MSAQEQLDELKQKIGVLIRLLMEVYPEATIIVSYILGIITAVLIYMIYGGRS